MTERGPTANRLSFDPLLLGFYAWLLTVAVPAFSTAAPLVSRTLSVAAVTMLLTGWLLAPRFPIVADFSVTAGYLGLCLSCWLTLGHARLTSNQAELRTVLGAIAWSLFGIAWVRARHAAVLTGRPETIQQARSTASLKPKSLSGVVHISLSLLLILVVLSRLGMPRGDGRGVLVTALALGWALWLLATSGVLAERFEHQTKGLSSRLLNQRAIVLAVVLACAGIIMSKLVKL